MAIAGKVSCTPKGEWVTGKAYEIIDIVKHNSASWLSRKDNNVTEPSESAVEDWLLLAKDGADGYSPTVEMNKEGRISTIVITDESGAHEFEVIDGADGTDGTDGEDGVDGVSPTVETSKSGKVTTITITDKNGDHVVTIKDGEDGDGSGDMLKSVYDTNNNGIVDEAEKVEFEGVQNIPYDTTPTENSDKLMKSKDIKAALDKKGDTLIYDEDNSKLKMYSGGKEGTLLSEVTIEGGGGGLKIGDVSGATISSHMTTVSLKWSDPNDIIADGTPLVEWGGTLLVRKEGSAPTGRDDGTVIIDNKTRNAYSETALTDTNVEYGKTYYYRFFTYSKTGSYTAGTSLSATPSRVIIENDPVQSGTLTYDGTEKTASFLNFDDTKMSISGNTGTNAGSYTAVFTLNEGYCWNNGSTDAKEVTWVIGNAVISAVPTVSAPLIWTGEELSPSWNGYDPDKLTIGGDTAGTDTGTYTAEFTPKTNYEWWDGSRETKEANWAIVLTIIENVPVQSGSLTYNGEAQAPTWINYDETKMTKTETAQTGAGDYSTTFTPLSGYCWANGSVDGKVIEWSIAKDTLTIPTLNAYNHTYDGTEKSVNFSNFDSTTMTKTGDSAINAGTHTATISISDTNNYEWSNHTAEAQSYNWTINKATLAVPTEGATALAYTGSEQTRDFNNYDPDTMNVSGNTGTDAGSYTATFSLKDENNYQWSGGDVADQEVGWTIGKADQVIAPQSSSVTLDTDHTSVTVNLTQTGDGDITVSTSDSSIATASILNRVLTIESVNAASGSATITLSAAETANYKACTATIAVTASFAIVYGFHINGAESDPASAVTYLKDAVGLTPAYMDYSAGAFNYGSWKNAFFMPRPCMLKSDGTVDYYLNPDDLTKKADGTTSDITNTSYDGNAMMEWGRDGRKIWVKVVPDSDTKSGSVYIANAQVDDDYHAYSFINNQGNLVEHFYTPIYNGSVISGKMRSLSGQAVSSKTTAQQEIDYAKANNAGSNILWQIENKADRDLINYLLILMGKSLNTQAVYGQGAHTSGTEAINNTFRTGVHNTKGLFYGTNAGTVASSSFANCVKVFGMENWYGFQWRRLLGWINDKGAQKVKYTYGTQDGSTTEGYNLTGEGYINTGATPAGTNGGYISESKFDEYGIHPKTASGSEVTYYCDGLWFNNSQVNVAIVGGYSNNGALVGALCVPLNAAASIAIWYIGAALSCKPLA